jgi:hypothetical protein
VSVAGVSKELFFETGGFPEGESRGEDIDFWAKIALHYPIAFSSDVGAIIHEEASGRACDYYYSFEESPCVKNGKKAINDGIVPQKMLPFFKEFIARKELDTAIINIFAGDFELARKVLARTETRYLLLEKMKWTIVTRIPKPVITLIRRTKNGISRKHTQML